MHPSPEGSICSSKSRKKKLHSNSAVKPSSISTFRGLQWRIKLGVLPHQSSTIEELRQAAADGRRRYVDFRRRSLVDPRAMEDPLRPQQSDMDNPLSQKPDSVWSRYFQNAELERTIDTDLTRLYPEHGSFFQNSICQAMLRRILLVWSLMHPQYSYKQGMHELLAPLLYVLQIDALQLAKVKHRYEDLFDDRFECPCLHDANSHDTRREHVGQFSTLNRVTATQMALCTTGKEEWLECRSSQNHGLLEMHESIDLKIMVLGSDPYGAEGELGALLSGRFVEHDAFTMFDALMSGNGCINMAEYFMAPVGANSASGLSTVLEASCLLYRALSAIDLPLYNHLTGLGVEPQFFAMRWLRVLFGREFDLEKILLVWDAIFEVKNSMSEENGLSSSSRRDFILALAISMLLYLKPSLQASPSATDCLKKLLNFPQTLQIEMLIDSAKILKPLIEQCKRHMCHLGPLMCMYENGKSRSSFQNERNSPKILPSSTFKQSHSSSEFLKKPLLDSYWEEKWNMSILRKSLPHIDENYSSEYECTGRSPNSKQGSTVEDIKLNAETETNDKAVPLHLKEAITIPSKGLLLNSSLSRKINAEEGAINGEKHTSGNHVKLERLGHCITDNIKVLEEAISAMSTPKSLECPIEYFDVARERPKNQPGCFLDMASCEEVKTALAELRKIGNTLLRM